MITVEGKWQEFVTEVYPDVSTESIQYEALKATFFSAYFCCLSTLFEIIGAPDVSEEKGEEILSRLTKESGEWIQGHISKLQRIGPEGVR